MHISIHVTESGFELFFVQVFSVSKHEDHHEDRDDGNVGSDDVSGVRLDCINVRRLLDQHLYLESNGEAHLDIGDVNRSQVAIVHK